MCRLTNKIYREILCITVTRHYHDDERTMIITMGGIDHNQDSAFHSNPRYKIVLSWDLLEWISEEDSIPSSFTNFITTPELSGDLYISPDIYHSQITEYCRRKFSSELFSLSASNIFLIVILFRDTFCCLSPDRTKV